MSFFEEPTLVRADRINEGRGHMDVRAYAERDSRDGSTANIPDEVTMCKGIYRVLANSFPGHAWAISVQADQGIASISIPALLGANWAYVLHLDTMNAAAIIKAGGEILERFNIPRSHCDVAAYLAAESNIPLIGYFRAKHRNRIPG